MIKTGYVQPSAKTFDNIYYGLIEEWKKVTNLPGWTWSTKEYDENRVLRACKKEGYDIKECTINWFRETGETRMAMITRQPLTEEDCLKIKKLASETIRTSQSYASGKFAGLIIVCSRKADPKDFFYYKETLSNKVGKTEKEEKEEHEKEILERREARKKAYAEAKKNNPNYGKRGPTAQQQIKTFLANEGFEDVKTSAGQVSCTYVTYDEIQDVEAYTKDLLRKLFKLRLNKQLCVKVGRGQESLFTDNGRDDADLYHEYPITVKIYKSYF